MNAALDAADTQEAMARLGIVRLGGPLGTMTERIAREGPVYRRSPPGSGSPWNSWP
ncbi:hypothetical protein ACFQU2_11595 [Siccirubricoccus deserti]